MLSRNTFPLAATLGLRRGTPSTLQKQQFVLANNPRLQWSRGMSGTHIGTAMADVKRINYPSPRRDDSIVEKHFGVAVPDPYRWMEDPDAEETKKFVMEQKSAYDNFMQNNKIYHTFLEKMTEVFNYPKFGCPYRAGDRYYYLHNTGLQNQYVYYVMDSLEGTPRVFLDPNEWSKDGTVAMGSKSFTDDGSILAYMVSAKGSDWSTIKFMPTKEGIKIEDCIERVRYSCLSWTHDNMGIFYNSYEMSSNDVDGTMVDRNSNQRLMYHVLGTPQEQDVVCAEFPDNPKWLSAAEVSDDGKYVFLSISESCSPKNKIWYCDLTHLSGGTLKDKMGKLKNNWVKLVDVFDFEVTCVTNEDNIVTVLTNKDAPKRRVMTLDLNNPKAEWKVLVPESKDRVLEDVSVAHRKFLMLTYIKDVKSEMEIRDLTTGDLVSTVSLSMGSVIGSSSDKKYPEVFFLLRSFSAPGSIFRIDLNANYKPKRFKETKIPGYDLSQLEVRQNFYMSEDPTGVQKPTRVPIYIIYKKGLHMNGSNPTLLYGYGGFNISMMPFFSVGYMMWMFHMGGILCIANIRGGGEYGMDWYEGGIIENKQNSFNDFIAAGEYLVKEKYTSPSKLVIEGASNGGMMVAACVNQRPDLFKVVLAHVGVMDLLRFHLFTIGSAWMSDYGNPEDAKGFANLIKISPLHNIHKVKESGHQFPATLVLTSDHDDRVTPLHSLKYIAELQHLMGKNENQSNPLIARIEIDAGHGAGKPISKVLEEVASSMAFAGEMVGAKFENMS